MTVLGHADRPVTLRRHGAVTVVDKRYSAGDGAVVHDTMMRLWRSPFGATRQPAAMPQPLGFTGGTLTMSYVTGEPVGTRGDPGRSDDLAIACADLLADLHGSRVQVARRRHAAALVRSLERKAAHLADHEHPAAGAFARAVHRLAAARPDIEQLVISHGDFAPRNVLCDDDGVVLIDFDRAQMASRARDVSYWVAWRWVTDLCERGVPDPDACRSFVERYRSRAGVGGTWDEPATMAFHRAASLLRIAEGWTTLRGDTPRMRKVIDEAVRSLA